MAKKTAPVLVRCIDCTHEKPVYNEFPAWDGTPVFCTCEHWHGDLYRNRRWPQPCPNFEQRNDEKLVQ